ncbi:transcriptional regulator GutM [Williamsia sp. CHRR-6]|uniref:transcriptional regulator GutM n=1 Tax=Williamsia sp. CHRR-6 TaxID=2835871 RepID=UPI001BD9637F|nr:transcriptional regulator GutM [Williamsia sp. CHRR-6]MBT0566038.1 hypothetical protein [Williamsia sp. CHRR-6]
MTLTFAAIFVVLWIGQMLLVYRQSQRYMRAVATLRAVGDTATGRHRKTGLRTFVSIAVVDGAVADARVLSGFTVFASPKPQPALIGARIDDLIAGPVDGVTPRVAAAATHAAELYRGQISTAARKRRSRARASHPRSLASAS